MREKLAGTGWLLVGAVAAIGVWAGLGDALAITLDGLLPGVWRRAALGVLVLARRRRPGDSRKRRPIWSALLM